MLAAIIRFSIRYNGIIIVLSALLLIYGSYRFIHAGLDIFPEFSPKQVIIQTEAPGFSAEQVEILVTRPIEMALNGLLGLETLRSESIQGLSIVTAIFSENSDIYRNRQMTSERLAGLSEQLPAGVMAPVAVPLSSSSATVLTLGLSSDSKSLMELRSLADWTLVPRLLAVPGVADVNIFGGEIRQLQIQIDPAQLRHFDLSVQDIVTAASQAIQFQGGGIMENSNQRFTLQIRGQPVTPEQLGKIIIKHDQSQSITLGDVTTIRYDAAPAIGAAQIGGKPGVVMMVIAQYGANTLTVSRATEAALAEFDAIFSREDIDFHKNLFRPADYIETSIKNLSGHLLLGGLFVLVILYMFLYNVRTAFICAIAIPVSMVSAIIILLEHGVNLNIMVLGGLAIALGEVVDDAIIDTENIFRRLRENRMLSNPLPHNEVIYAASMEVRSSVVYASFIVALVFVPLLTLGGVAGRLFAPLGYSYILAILMSLLVALTLTPALCSLLLDLRNQKTTQAPPLVRKIAPGYRVLLETVSQHFALLLIASTTLFLLSLLALTNLGGKFLPELREGHYIVHTASIPGTSLQESIRIGTRITDQISQLPGVESVSQWAGRAERGADTYGSHYSEFEVRLQPLPGAGQERVKQKIRAILGSFPGIRYEANTFLTERIDETISGYTSPVVVNIYGHNLDELDRKAREVEAVMQTLHGADDVQVRSPAGTPVLQVQMNLDQLIHWGIRPAEVSDTLQAAYEGRITGKNIIDNQIYDIAVILAPELRQTPHIIQQLPIRSLDGSLIGLQQLADIYYSTGHYNILHQQAQRKQTVTCNITDRNPAEFLQELKQRVLEDVSFSAQVYPEFTGSIVEQANARKQLLLHSLLAGTGVLILIYIALGNLRNMLLTLSNLPFALTGGILAVLISGDTLSIGSIVGFITLFGITVRNSIMLISHYHYLIETDKHPWTMATAIRGAQERLPSILMTALVTALAMFPIAFNSDNPGREIMGPMATIIIGGLVSSTALNLLLFPGLLLRYGQFQAKPEMES